MVEHVRSLRHPVQIEVDGRSVRLVTIGYISKALGRTPWTIKHWIRLGLFPEPSHLLNPNDDRTLRRLYPEHFVDALAVIASRGYVGRRLDRDKWHRFHYEVFSAYKVAMTGLTGVVTAETDTDALRDEGGQAEASLERVV